MKEGTIAWLIQKYIEEMSDKDYADACAMLKAWKPKAKA